MIGPGNTHLYGRLYGWDGVGNLNAIAVWENSTGGVPRQSLNFAYDDRDRLTHAWTGGANANGTGAGPHQAVTVGGPGNTNTYDTNGNITSSGGRSYTWDTANHPTSITSSGTTESYVYDADDNRVA